MNKKNGAEVSTNENLLPLLHISRQLLGLSIVDDTARMLALDVNTSLSVNMTADKVERNEPARRMVRAVLRKDRLHVSFGMTHIEKYDIKDMNEVEIANTIYEYLKFGDGTLKENVASYQE